MLQQVLYNKEVAQRYTPALAHTDRNMYLHAYIHKVCMYSEQWAILEEK